MQIEVINPGETLGVLATRYGISVEDIMAVNQIDDPLRPVPGQALLVPAEHRIHVVRPGENVWLLVGKYGVPAEAIALQNGLANPALLVPGALLRIPAYRGPKITIETNGYLYAENLDFDRREIDDSARALTYLSPFQYVAQRDGSLQPPNEEAMPSDFNRMRRAVPMMVLTNFGEGAFSADKARVFFTDAVIREKLIVSVLDTLQSGGFYALNVDFEQIHPEDRDKYTAFLRELASRVRAQGKLFSTALAPKTGGPQAGPWYDAHDYRAHGGIADFVILMTYEWGWSGGPPMPVAPLPQVRRVLDYAVSVIPRHKIMLGAPLYGYDWILPYKPGGPFAAMLSPQEAVRLAGDAGSYIQYDPAAQAPFFRYYDKDSKEHLVWFEDARSMQAKFDLVKLYGLRGISYWVLGQSFPQNWTLLEANFLIKRYR